MLAQLRTPLLGFPEPQWIGNTRNKLGEQWYTQVLAFANPDYPPVEVTNIPCLGPPRGFPYGVDVLPDH